MNQELNEKECRVIGCLMEKSVVTPDQYPLTLNALTNACNQKSSRNPVMALSQGEVQHTIRILESQHLVHIEENFKRGVEKYSHRFCNTRFNELTLDAAGFAVICLLLLRGPQTPGELRANSGRLHDFADNESVVSTLQALIEREEGAVVVKLPRTPGRKDSEYMHLFSGEIDLDQYAEQNASSRAVDSKPRTSVADLELRMSQLEEEVDRLKKLIQEG